MSAATKKAPKAGPTASASTLDPHLQRIRALATKLLDENSPDTDQQIAARLLTVGDITLADTLRVAHDHLRGSASNRIAESGFCEPLVSELMICVRDWLDLTHRIEFNDGEWKHQGEPLASVKASPAHRQLGPADWKGIQQLGEAVRDENGGSTPPGDGWVAGEIISRADADEVGAVRFAKMLLDEEVRYQDDAAGGVSPLTGALARALVTWLWDAGDDAGRTAGNDQIQPPAPQPLVTEDRRLTLEEHRDRARDLAWEVEALAWTLFRWIDSTIAADLSLREREHLQNLLRTMRDRTAELSVHAGEGSG